MPIKRNIIIYSSILLLSLILIILLHYDNQTQQNTIENKHIFPNLVKKSELIQKIKLTGSVTRQENNTVELERVGDFWYLSRFREKKIFFPANKQIVNSLLDKIINIKQLSSTKADDRKIYHFRLEQPKNDNFQNSGFKVELLDKTNTVISSLIIGANSTGIEKNFIINYAQPQLIITSDTKFELPLLDTMDLLDNKIIPKFNFNSKDFYTIEIKEQNKKPIIFKAQEYDGTKVFLIGKKEKEQPLSLKDKELDSIVRDRILSLFEVVTVNDIKFNQDKSKLNNKSKYIIKVFITLQNNIKFVVSSNFYQNTIYNNKQSEFIISLEALPITKNLITNKITADLNQYWKDSLFYLDEVMSKYMVKMSFDTIYKQ